MTDQPNKPDAEDRHGDPEPVVDQAAVENQGGTTPDAYPDPARLDDADRQD